MLRMSKLRERQKGLLWTLLFFFVASMTVGGLVGGANIIDVIRSAFGSVDTRLYVGRIGDQNITISQYLSERQNQINRFRQQGRTIDNRAIQSAGDVAWNTIIERKIKDEKIDEFNLSVQENEIYDFLLQTPPNSFQNNLKDLGLFKNEENEFLIEDYQSAVRNGTLPDTTRQLLIIWENYLKTFLADRKLQNLYNNIASVSDSEVKNDYLQNNINCTIDVLNINYDTIDDSLIIISEEEINERYESDKEEKYKKDESVTMEYFLFNNIDQSGLDSTNIVDQQDSLLQLAIDFASDAQITSFKEALNEYEYEATDTIKITESFTNNSGIPFQMGTLRQAVRFAFDNNNEYESSDAFTTDNGIVIFNKINENSSTFKNLNEVKSSIKRTLLHDKKKDYALNLLKNIDASSDWEKINQENSLIEFFSDIESTIGGNFQNIGRSSAMSGFLIEMNKNEVSDVIQSSRNAFYIKLKSKGDFDEEKYYEIFDSLKNQLLAKERNSIYNSWLNNEKKSIEIKDLRHKIF